MSDGRYDIDADELNLINQEKDSEAWLDKLGGLRGVATALKTDLHAGLPADDVEAHREAFGVNKYKEVPAKSFLSILLRTMNDPVLWLLMAAAAVSTVLGAAIPDERAENAWLDGVFIWCAVFLVSGVGSYNDYMKELQFRELNAQKDIIEMKVMRDGKEQVICNEDVVVGDVIVLDTGDKVIADGVVIDSHGLIIDEASLTGESDPIKKSADGDFWCRSGTQVTEGDGRVMVTAVGPNSEWGIIMEKVTVAEEEETPLQEKLGVVAMSIGKVGGLVAALAFVIMLIRWCVENGGFPISEINNDGPIQFFLYAVTIIVVAVPEGLPLAVAISLSYSMKKMMKDNNFVRHLSACETMGGATAICSDKTGTLTENRMTVVEGWFSGVKYDTPPSKAQLPASVAEDIIKNICLNSKAFYVETPGQKTQFVGNRTECALLQLCQDALGVPYDDVRKKHEDAVKEVYGFSSAKKMASVLVDQGNGTLRLYNKGASEWVLDKSVAVHMQDGSVIPLTPARRQELLDVVTEMATRGLRTLVLAYTDFAAEDPGRASDFFEVAPDQDLIVTCIVGIKDPVRREVPGAVETCKRAGIVVRMVTGDNVHTAKHIARECGILDDGGFAIEGPEFRRQVAEDREAFKAKIGLLQVMARSSPTDKHTLVNMLRELGEVVAVTGDGTNDAPALKESDVGLAMGISGTEVAKEAADIVILDDNFKSIVLAVLWGRSIFSNIRKFLQFQLTINIVALIVAFIGAFVSKQPLNVIMLLWVNMIMDSLAALALATEPPHVSLLSDKPHGRDEHLINRTMWKHMLVGAVYQIFWMLLIMFGAPEVFDHYRIRNSCEVFNAQYTWYAPGTKDHEYFCDSSDVSDLADSSKWNQAYTPKAVCEFAYPVPDGCTSQCCPQLERPPRAFTDTWPIFNGATCASDAECSQLYDNAGSVRAVLAPALKVWNEWDGSRGFRAHAKEHDEMSSKSLLFNVFIFMQLFNEINSRKIQDEYNVFAGMFDSWIFSAVLLITAALQVVIMETPVSNAFHVDGLDGLEWAVSIIIGAGMLPLSFLTRVVTREIFGVNVPKEGVDRVPMDIGYGAVVDHSYDKLAQDSSDSDYEKGEGRPSDFSMTDIVQRTPDKVDITKDGELA